MQIFKKNVLFFSRFRVIHLELDICIVKYQKQVNYKISCHSSNILKDCHLMKGLRKRFKFIHPALFRSYLRGGILELYLSVQFDR